MQLIKIFKVVCVTRGALLLVSCIPSLQAGQSLEILEMILPSSTTDYIWLGEKADWSEKPEKAGLWYEMEIEYVCLDHLTGVSHCQRIMENKTPFRKKNERSCPPSHEALLTGQADRLFCHRYYFSPSKALKAMATNWILVSNTSFLKYLWMETAQWRVFQTIL